MQGFREELESAAKSREKINARMWALRKFIFWHYVLLILSIAQSSLALFAVVNVNVPFRGTLFLLTSASLILSLYSLLSGISSK